MNRCCVLEKRNGDTDLELYSHFGDLYDSSDAELILEKYREVKFSNESQMYSM
jgi:hypothetical protein